MSTLRIFAAVSSLLMAASPAFAASDYLLQLDPVKGESMETAAPQNIEVESFSWGASNPSSAATGSGAGAGKVNVQDLSVTKARHPATPCPAWRPASVQRRLPSQTDRRPQR